MPAVRGRVVRRAVRTPGSPSVARGRVLLGKRSAALSRRRFWRRHGGRSPGPGSARLAFGDLAQVAEGEYDPAPVQMKRHLLAVRPGPQRALRHVGEAEVAENLGGLTWAEDLGKAGCAQVTDCIRRLGETANCQVSAVPSDPAP
jgi:hypothetical protein